MLVEYGDSPSTISSTSLTDSNYPTEGRWLQADRLVGFMLRILQPGGGALDGLKRVITSHSGATVSFAAIGGLATGLTGLRAAKQ